MQQEGEGSREEDKQRKLKRDQALNHYPESFAWFGQGYVWGALSFEFALFILLARQPRGG
jgi:ribose/xylose/arabinose/galactoside ABC-type transport system permease subunit